MNVKLFQKASGDMFNLILRQNQRLELAPNVTQDGDTVVTHTDKDKADTLNGFFSSVFTEKILPTVCLLLPQLLGLMK